MPEPETPESSQSHRLIVPGAEAEAAAAPRIITPSEARAKPAPPSLEPSEDESAHDESEVAPRASRIILPPGVARGAPEDLPEYPKLRPLVLVPVSNGKREFLLVTDPLGVTPGQPVLGIEALGLLQLLDGSASLTEISAAVMRESKDLRVGNMVREFIGQDLFGTLRIFCSKYNRRCTRK